MCGVPIMIICNYSTNPSFSFAQNSQINWLLYTNYNFLIHLQPDHACLWYFKLLLSDLSLDISCFKYQRYKDEIIGIWASNQFLIKKFFHFWTIFKYFNLIYKSIVHLFYSSMDLNVFRKIVQLPACTIYIQGHILGIQSRFYIKCSAPGMYYLYPGSYPRNSEQVLDIMFSSWHVLSISRVIS